MFLTIEGHRINTEQVTDIYVGEDDWVVRDPDTGERALVNNCWFTVTRWFVKYRVVAPGEIGYGTLAGPFRTKEDAEKAHREITDTINEALRPVFASTTTGEES